MPMINWTNDNTARRNKKSRKATQTFASSTHSATLTAMVTFSDNIMGAIEFTVTWTKDGVSHKEWFLGRKINPVNDIFPRNMRQALEGKKAGESVTFSYEPRQCIPRHRPTLVRTLPLDRLRKKTRFGAPIIPLVGRFYPQGHIDGLLDVYPDTLTPFRLIELTGTTFTADCNHPLANIPVTITATIQDLKPREIGTYGSLTLWREATCDWGPGMQAMFDGQPTDFFHPAFFDRTDTSDTPFTPPRLDAKAAHNLQAIYDHFIKSGMRVLDFSLAAAQKPEGEYQAAVCEQSMEYMTDPVAVLEEVKSHLAPGSPVIVAFSNRFEAGRAIKGWTDMHEFERMGLVLEYLRRAGLDNDAGTFSIRNDWRGTNDPRFLETRGVSDPVYTVYGHKE